MSLRVRLLLGFMTIAALVAINGVTGIGAVSGISDEANDLINGEFTTQAQTSAARLGTVEAIAMSRAYVSRVDANLFFEHLLNERLQATSATIRSFDEPRLVEITTAALDHQGEFEQSVSGLLSAHKLAAAYEFEFEDLRYDLSSFIEHVAFSLSIWSQKLESAVAYSGSFDGSLDAGDSVYARWRPSFDTNDEKLASLLADYDRINVEVHDKAAGILQEASSKRAQMLKAFREYTLLDAKLTLQDLNTHVAPLVAQAVAARAASLEKVEGAAATVQRDLDGLRDAVALQVEDSKNEMARSQKRSSLTFILVTGGSFVAALVGGFWLSGSIARPIRELSRTMKEVAAGNLGARLNVTGRGEVAELGSSFGSMRDALRDLVSGLVEGVSELSSSSSQIATTAKAAAALASEQAATVSQVSATTEQMRQTATTTVANASEVVAASESASSSGRSGVEETQEVADAIASLTEQVDEVARRILHLSEQSTRIGTIVTQVNDIAEQSNLLAVNASIEASKAGEQGWGFGVVATEIRKLAEESKQSTNQIRAILEDIERATASSVMVTEEATKRAVGGREKVEHLREVIEELANALDENAGMAQQIEAATNQSAAGIQQVAQAMDSMRQASGDGARGAEELERSVNAISGLAQRLEAATAEYAL